MCGNSTLMIAKPYQNSVVQMHQMLIKSNMKMIIKYPIKKNEYKDLIKNFKP